MKYHLPALLIVLSLLSARAAYGQSFGVELLNNVMPASGGMAGTSIASPQDVQSAVYGNPSTIAQFRGTHFGFGGGWIEPTYNLTVDQRLPFIDVDPFTNAKSDAQGVAAGNVGVAQDLRSRGLPITIGLGLFAGAGAGVDFRHIPESNGTYANIVALDIVTGVGVDLTDRLAMGASLHLSNATLAGPFVGISGASSDYALRGSLGFDFDLSSDTVVGAYWRTQAGYTFENLVGFDPPLPPGSPPGTFLNVQVDRPEMVGLGISNSSLMNGCLLLAMDASYQKYSDTALFGALFDDQWALQFGAQYSLSERARLRMGYAWNENPMLDQVGGSIGGVLPPGGAAHVQYIESLFAAIPQHRITGGLSVRDVLPGVDWDLFAGGAFEAEQTFGLATASVESYWIGSGITWHFGCGAGGKDEEK